MDKTYNRNNLVGPAGLLLPQMFLMLICSISVNSPVLAQTNTYQGGTSQYQHEKAKVKTYLQSHPKVRKAAIGAGIGTAGGAAVGLLSGRGVVRGAAIGAGTGATVGAVSGSKTLKNHPYMRSMAEGSIGGAGLSLAMNRGHNEGKRTVEGAALGAAAGLGAGFFKKEFH